MTTNEAITILEEIELIDDSIYQYNEKYLEALDMAIQALKNKQTNGDSISQQVVLKVLGENKLPTIPQIIITKEDIEKVNKILENKDFWKINDKAVELLNKQINSIDIILEEIKAEIDTLPRIKVGNSNSPTVKYCINEVLLYDLLEHYKERGEE